MVLVKWLSRTAALLILGTSVTGYSSSIEEVFRRESNLVLWFHERKPVVETYIQGIGKANATGNDVYFLGELDASEPSRRPLPYRPGFSVRLLYGRNAKERRMRSHDLRVTFHPEGFVSMMFVDMDSFDEKSYKLTMQRSENLQGVPCDIYRVTPINEKEAGRFHGLIWVESASSKIIRLTGTYTPVTARPDHYLRFDSWRAEVEPGLWAPVYVYSETSHEFPVAGLEDASFRSQTYVWRYDRKYPEMHHVPQLHRRGDGDATQTPREPKLIRLLENNGLLARKGEVEQHLDAIVALLVSNVPELRATHVRVLLTTPMEAFATGDTLVVSRGLVDTIADEATLAVVLSHELAHLVLGHTDKTIGLPDDADVFAASPGIFQRLNLHNNPERERQANAVAVELLRNSPYAGQIVTAAKFGVEARSGSAAFPNLFTGRFGGSLLLGREFVIDTGTPTLSSNVTMAYPLGSRLNLRAGNDAVAFSRSYRFDPSMLSIPCAILPKTPLITAGASVQAQAVPSN